MGCLPGPAMVPTTRPGEESVWSNAGSWVAAGVAVAGWMHALGRRSARGPGHLLGARADAGLRGRAVRRCCSPPRTLRPTRACCTPRCARPRSRRSTPAGRSPAGDPALTERARRGALCHRPEVAPPLDGQGYRFGPGWAGAATASGAPLTTGGWRIEALRPPSGIGVAGSARARRARADAASRTPRVGRIGSCRSADRRWTAPLRNRRWSRSRSRPSAQSGRRGRRRARAAAGCRRSSAISTSSTRAGAGG